VQGRARQSGSLEVTGSLDASASMESASALKRAHVLNLIIPKGQSVSSDLSCTTIVTSNSSFSLGNSMAERVTESGDSSEGMEHCSRVSSPY